MIEVGTSIQKAKNILDQGDIVAIPTETVYGLAANALDTEAVVKIFEAKNRPYFNPLIIHIASKKQLDKYVQEIPEALRLLMDHFWPGPLTLLLKKKAIIPDLVTAGSPLVAVRVPSHEMCRKLLEQLDYPVAAPSANPFGYISPVTAKHVSDQLEGKLTYVLDGGTSTVGLESTIIGFDNGQVIVYRLGGIPLEEIEKVIGPVKLITKSLKSPQTSGMLKHHYSPRKELLLYEDTIPENEQNNKNCLLTFNQYSDGLPKENQFLLSENGDMKEAAKKLFPLLHQLDESSFKKIIAIKLPEIGLGRAINDRLKRASSNY